MTELEKLDAGQEYDFLDAEVAARKENALRLCQELERVDAADFPAQEVVAKRLLGSTGEHVYLQPGFRCDNGQNIHVGEAFLTNYNVTILDIMPVHIGDYCMIGPGTTISTVGHPLSPAGRRAHLAKGEPVTIGDDVWMGANVAVMPGVTIGSNVVIAAGAVVTKDVPDNVIVAGVPARVVRAIDDDVDTRGTAR
ncbi:Maltose/galactoside acetyltransferase [Propionibacterium ruminifibrarum]|uniref:Acetyltransferase n=1 Tax=Propionibacterium ruminifibrarum TaxID=1962131 RepID=A0A375I552_9ACTN|nr:sugar O-acetyltransferase [Propionibacterium ruminifibrarum]SPF68917.1 Maltose/galactoside acetyltransferase [Propionibacterium ruminifibrarum]